MNTIQIQLNDKQFDALQELITYAMDHLEHRISTEGDNGYRDDFKAELAMAGEVSGVLNETKEYLWTDSYGYISLEIAAEHVNAIAVSGDNEPACLAAIENDGYLRHQLGEMDMEAAVNVLKDAGIEDVDRKSNDEIRTYVLWMACHDINEERNMED